MAVVHNRGMIAGTPDQVAILQLRLGSDEGDWIEREPSKGDEDKAKAAEAPMHRHPANHIPNIVNLEL